ncbi:MAG TPA: Gfo/Idh/MocA family oxidoreductase [Propionibacteriaceae bacterium]
MIRFALFGCGRIGRVHADSIDVHPRAELAWVYDPIESAASEVAKRYGTTIAPAVDVAIDDPSVDAVVIASATPTHVDLLTRAVQAGKALLCEKPIDLDLARVDRCWTDIAALNPIVMLGFNRRFDPSFREVRDRVAAGDIGRLEQLTIVSRDPAPAAPEYLNFFLDRYTPAYRAELDHLITAMEQGEQPSPGFDDGREALALADAARESLQTGQTVRLGPS